MFEVLVKLVTFKTLVHEAHLSSIMLDVVLRVEELRAEACEISLNVLEKFDVLKSEKCEALTALLFILGEFAGYLSADLQEKALVLLTKPRWDMIGFSESVYNALSSTLFKLGLLLDNDLCLKKIKETSLQIDHMEAQERSLMYINILGNSKKEDILTVLQPFLPIHPSAQSFINPPEDLLTPFLINNEELVSTKPDGTLEYHYFRDEDFGDIGMTDEEKLLAKAKIKEKHSQDPYYIKPKKGKKKKGKKPKKTEAAEETKEIVQETIEKKIEIPKKYSVNKTEPLLPS